MTESQNIEWKESWRDEYFKWVSGYANAQGGKLFIDGDGAVLGIDNARELLEKLPNQMRQFMGIIVDVMVQACRKYGSPEPVLRYEDSGFWVEFGAKVVTGK